MHWTRIASRVIMENWQEQHNDLKGEVAQLAGENGQGIGAFGYSELATTSSCECGNTDY
jgi:hypothetical protein